MKERRTGQPRGFGFVTYADPSVVDKVIEDDHVINGKQVRLHLHFLFHFILIISSLGISFLLFILDGRIVGPHTDVLIVSGGNQANHS